MGASQVVGSRSASAPAQPDTAPKLLLRNAEIYAHRPAIRHKDLGIWQTWTWDRFADEVCAFAIGLRKLGFEVSGARVGRLIDLEVEGSVDEARTKVDEMCHKLLANPLIESYEIELHDT